jgi:hypothetical protein
LKEFLLEESKHSEATYLTKFHEMVKLMYESLEKLIRLDQQLNSLQPVHNGRLRIQWNSYQANEVHFAGERYPRFVQWNRNFNLGIWRAKKVPIARVLKFQHKARAFKSNADKARELLVNMRELILIYRQARKTLAQLRGPSSHWVNTNKKRLQKMQVLCVPLYQDTDTACI